MSKDLQSIPITLLAYWSPPRHSGITVGITDWGVIQLWEAMAGFILVLLQHCDHQLIRCDSSSERQWLASLLSFSSTATISWSRRDSSPERWWLESRLDQLTAAVLSVTGKRWSNTPSTRPSNDTRKPWPRLHSWHPAEDCDGLSLDEKKEKRKK